MAKRAKKPAGRTHFWGQRPTGADVEVLRSRISARGPLWDQWEYKLHRDRILIYDVSVQVDREPGRPESALRTTHVHLRVSPAPSGPFELEWMRHTGQWWPLHVTGTIEQIADAIAGGKVPMTRPMEQGGYEADPSRYARPAETE